MALLDDNREVETKPRPGQDRSLNRPVNPDWEGGKGSGQVTRQDTSTGRFSRATVDQNFAYQAFRENLLGPLGIGDNSAKTDKAKTEEEEQAKATEEANQAIRRAQTNSRASARTQSRERRQLPTINLVGDAKARVTVTRITATNAPWLLTLAGVQIVLALLSIVSLGVVAGLNSIFSSDTNSEYTNVFSWLAANAADLVTSVANSVLQFVGLDFAGIALMVWGGLYMLIIAIGLFSILAMYGQYIVDGLNPTTGKASGLKMGMLLLAILGYCTPMLNMFPFIFLWMAAVWYHPK